jgi:drug/metabolite transporter (DMT)-like permease
MRSRSAYLNVLAFLFSHEVDAAFRHEWRVLPLTSFMPEDAGRETFIWAHVPLIAGLLLGGEPRTVRASVAVFSIAHVGLHWIYRHHPANAFNTLSSWLLILGAGLSGALYLLLARRDGAAHARPS